MKKVLVIKGGWSQERDVSLRAGKDVEESLRRQGYNVFSLDIVDRTSFREILSFNPQPGVVFNALYGRCGEDGCVAGFFNIYGLPYTHSGTLPAAIGMEKDITKMLAATLGIKVLPSQKVHPSGPFPLWKKPCVAKPNDSGSSVKCEVLSCEKDLHIYAQSAQSPFLLEEYVSDGIDITVAILKNRVLGSLEIQTSSVFYDYSAKYHDQRTQYFYPPRIPEKTKKEAEEAALLLHKTLGCNNISRSDFIFDGQKIFFLEINTNPGIGETSLVPRIAKYCGMSFDDVIQCLLESASYGHNENP